MLNKVTIPTFVIGIGGVGCQVALEIANRFKNSEWEEIPETIRIRAFDSTDLPLKNKSDLESLNGFRFTPLSDFNADAIVRNLPLYPELQRWWNYNIAPKYIDSGAGAKRPVGRLIFFHRFLQIYNALSDDFKKPLDQDLQTSLVQHGLDTVKKSPQVFIVGSLAGGTCAGMFLDMAFLTRNLLEKCGYERGAGIQITGIFGLPSVIEADAKDGHLAQGQDRRINAYAALTELDYLLGDLPPEFKLQYPSPLGDLEPKDQVFNQIYLFTDTKMDGIRFPTQEPILKRVSYFIYSLIASGTGKEVRDHLDNFKAYFNVGERRLRDGLKAVYGSFGIEWLEVPEKYLVQKWCRKLAGKVATLLADFEWDREPKVNLRQDVRNRFYQKSPLLNSALELQESDPKAITQLDDLQALQQFMPNIQSARKEGELETALNELLSEMPSILHKLEARFSKIPNATDQAQWILETTLELIRDPRYRVGGAKRFLKEAATQLRMLGEQDLTVEYEVKQIVKRCRKGWISRKIDVAQAIEATYELTAHHARASLRRRLGTTSTQLAFYCQELSSVLNQIQDQIRSAGQSIAAEVEEVSEAEQQTWLLDPDDIDKALGDNKDEVARKVVDEVAKSLSREIEKHFKPGTLFQIENLEENFKSWLTLAVDRIAEQETTRPKDTVDRLKARMKQCQPLARIIDSGPEQKEIMDESKLATPLKLVFTGIGKDKKSELDKWAQEENQQAGPPQKPFGFFFTDNRLHDDVVYLTLGWPLWLFNEVREACKQAWDQASEKDPTKIKNSLIMNELPGANHHDIRPMKTEDARKWFAVALALDHIRFVSEDLTEFSQDVFGPVPQLRSQGKNWCRRAFDQFRELGLTWNYRRHIQDRIEKSKDPKAADNLRNEIEGSVKKKTEKIEENKEKLGQTLYDELRGYYDLARQYASTLYSL